MEDGWFGGFTVFLAESSLESGALYGVNALNYSHAEWISTPPSVRTLFQDAR